MKYIFIFKKDWQSELRTRYAINALAMFILVTISVILFSIGQEKISEYLTGGLLWVVIFFSAMSGLSRAFVSEEERGTTLTLQLIANALRAGIRAPFLSSPARRWAASAGHH